MTVGNIPKENILFFDQLSYLDGITISEVQIVTVGKLQLLQYSFVNKKKGYNTVTLQHVDAPHLTP